MLPGRLAPEEMFPAGRAELRVRHVRIPSGLSLRVVEGGEDSAPPVVLLHGWGASVYMWRDWFAPLAAAGFRAIAVDLPGHGLSDKPGDPGAYTLARMAGAIRELIVQERWTGAPVVAQSMAGTIAVLLGVEADPVIGPLVLVNPALFGVIRLQAVGRLASPRITARVLPRLVPRWIVKRAHALVYGDPSRITSRDVDEYWAPSQFPGYTRAMRQLLHEFTWHREPVARAATRLRALRSRALVVLGGRDRLVRDAGPYVRALCEAGAPLVVHEVPHAGHAANEEVPEAVIPRVLRFLDAARR